MKKVISLGGYIAERRKELRLEQNELMERLRERGVNRATSTLSGWEHSRQQVPLEFLPAIADALEVSVIELYEAIGILNNIRGSEILKLLDGLPDSDIGKIQRMIETLFENAG